jgi:hypothetical protein
MSQANRLVEELKDGEWHSNFELIRSVYKRNGPSSARLAARIYDLKQRGYLIETMYDETNHKRYWYRMTDPAGFTLMRKKMKLVAV